MIIQSNELKLHKTEKELISGVLAELVSDFYKDEKNLSSFRKEKKSLQKEVKALEVKRNLASKKQKSEATCNGD